MEREGLSSSRWYPATGRVAMVQSCSLGLHWTLGTVCWPRGTAFLEVVNAPSLSVFERHLDNAFINMLQLGQPSIHQAVGLGDHHRSLPDGRVYPTTEQTQEESIGSE